MNSEWQKHNFTLNRPLRGSEYLVNQSEVHNRGNYQLTFGVPICTNRDAEWLKANIKRSWIDTRKQFPLVGVELTGPHGELDQAIFRCLRTSKDAESWINSSLSIIEDKSVTIQDVVDFCLNNPLDTPGRITKLYLLCGAQETGVILHTSHALTGHYSLKVLDEVLENLAQDDKNGSIYQHFIAEDADSSASKLPQSVEFTYRQQYQPSNTIVQQKVIEAASKFQPPVEESVGFKLRNQVLDSFRFHNDTIRISNSKKLMKGLRARRVSPTTALFACIVSAMRQKEDKYAPLQFSTHASRWLKTDNEQHPISMAIVPSGTYVSLHDLGGDSSTETLEALSHRIAEAQAALLASPHIMGLAEVVASGMRREKAPLFPDARPVKSPPILTSQGVLQLREEHHGSHSIVRSLNLILAGRNSDPTICFSMHTFRGELRISVMYEDRFFDPNAVAKLHRKVSQLFKSMADPPSLVQSHL